MCSFPQDVIPREVTGLISTTQEKLHEMVQQSVVSATEATNEGHLFSSPRLPSTVITILGLLYFLSSLSYHIHFFEYQPCPPPSPPYQPPSLSLYYHYFLSSLSIHIHFLLFHIGRKELSSMGLPGAVETHKTGGQLPENVWMKAQRMQSMGGLGSLQTR